MVKYLLKYVKMLFMVVNDGFSGFTARFGFFVATVLYEDFWCLCVDCLDLLDVVSN